MKYNVNINKMKSRLNLTCTKKIMLIAAMLLSCLPGMNAQIVDVWAVGDGEKIFKYRTEHPSKERNSIWDGEKILLRGLYNEVLGFQIIVEVDSTGARGLQISMRPPLQKSTGRVIGGSGAIPYGDHGYIELFSQHYLQVRRPTEPNWFYGSENSAPEEMTGWIPDALIPSNALSGKGGFPLDIPPTRAEVRRHQNIVERLPRRASQNQGFWIDLYLPRDPDFTPGLYESEIHVWESGKISATIPVRIELLNAYLPDENHSNVWMFNSGVESLGRYFPELHPQEIRRLIKFEAKRHRIELVGGFGAHQSVFDEDVLLDYKPFLDGTAYSPALGYHGPGEGVGEVSVFSGNQK